MRPDLKDITTGRTEGGFMYYDKQIKIATGGSRKAVSWVVQEISWSAFLLKLSQPVRTPETFQEDRKSVV